MDITRFKEGEIITRNAPVKYSHNGIMDSSYCGERLVFRGHDPESKVILFELRGDIHDLSYAREAWNEGWAKYPETLYQKAKNALEAGTKTR